jgi:hypothetical protein
LCVLALWLLSSLPFLPASGPLAFIEGPLSLPFMLSTAYVRYVGEPMFRRNMHLGMPKDEVQALARRASGEITEHGSAVTIKFTEAATVCYGEGTQWKIWFNRSGEADLWSITNWADGC